MADGGRLEQAATNGSIPNAAFQLDEHSAMPVVDHVDRPLYETYETYKSQPIYNVSQHLDTQQQFDERYFLD